jgi:hypothetical protein
MWLTVTHQTPKYAVSSGPYSRPSHLPGSPRSFVIYRDSDFGGVAFHPPKGSSIYADMTPAKRHEEASWHRRLFKVFREMYTVREFRLVLCATFGTAWRVRRRSAETGNCGGKSGEEVRLSALGTVGNLQPSGVTGALGDRSGVGVGYRWPTSEKGRVRSIFTHSVDKIFCSVGVE